MGLRQAACNCKLVVLLSKRDNMRMWRLCHVHFTTPTLGYTTPMAAFSSPDAPNLLMDGPSPSFQAEAFFIRSLKCFLAFSVTCRDEINDYSRARFIAMAVIFLLA